MKKSVVVIIALVVIVAIVVCVVVLGGKKDNGNLPNTPENTIDCKTTGEHVYEKGACKGCGLKAFDVLKEYLIENGRAWGDGYTIDFGNYETDEYYGSLTYYTKQNYISIGANYQSVPGLSKPHIYDIGLRFTPYTFEDGGYQWSAGCKRISCTCPSISGVLNPEKFSSSTSTLEHTSSESGADDIARQGRKALQGFISNYLIDFLKGVGNNISISSIGFTRYE